MRLIFVRKKKYVYRESIDKFVCDIRILNGYLVFRFDAKVLRFEFVLVD